MRIIEKQLSRTRLSLACLGALALIGSAHAALPTEARDYRIAAGPLAAQIKQFAQQSGLAIEVDERALRDLRGAAFNGSASPQHALDHLLAHTGLRLKEEDGRYRLDGGVEVLPPVIVTGEKINRSLQNTTTAVSVLRGHDLDQGGQRSVYDELSRAPNVTANGAGIPNIRGMAGTGPSTGVFSLISGARPRISTSVDGVSENWSGQRYLDAGLWDVEQVEVLRGPQSTTQGRNTIGGAIVVKTRDPSFDWEGAARAGYEDEDGKALLAGMVSGPIVKDQLAFRIAAEALRGHGYIDYPGDWPWNPSETRRSNVRAKLLWTPQALPGFDARLTVSRRDQKGEYLNTVDGADIFAYQFNGIASNTRYQDSATTTVAGELNYRLSNAWTGHLLWSHGDYRAYFQESGKDRFSLRLDDDSDSLETRFVFQPEGGVFSGVVGLYYYGRHQDLDANPDGFVGDDQVKTTALFGESTLVLNETLSLTVGGRVEREEQKRDVLAWPGKPWQGHVRTDIGETMLLPKLGLSYRASPETTLGLTARKGYNAGGGSIDWNTSEFYEYGKEEVETYELSSRSRLFDRTLSLDANLFLNRYEGYQALLNRRFLNIPKGRSYGLEISATARPAAKLEVFGSLGLLNTEITATDAATAGLKGRRFNYAPKMTANLGLKKRLDSGWFFGGDLAYVGNYYSEVDNDERLEAGGYSVANLHLGYETDQFSVRAYLRNLADRKVLYYRTSSLAQVGQPRTVGLTVDYRFW